MRYSQERKKGKKLDFLKLQEKRYPGRGMSKLQAQPLGHAWACLRNSKKTTIPSSRGSSLQGLNLSLASPALAGGFFTNSVTWKVQGMDK